MVTLFRTGHDINERVCDALAKGFAGDDIAATYGVLRGAGAWAKAQKKPTLLLDRGYFKPGHFDGYYRLAWQGTQAMFESGSGPMRWDSLHLPLEEWKPRGTHALICPPTQPVAEFYGLNRHGVAWGEWMGNQAVVACKGEFVVTIRTKDCTIPLENHLKDCACVVTFNSGVGWEALRRGIPVISDVRHSTVGSFLGTAIADLGKPMQGVDRRALFSFMANRQFTLQEIENGTARSYLL